ncbi:MAG: hypothetical protein KAG64_00095 [Bacteroidales bacterium]|nr:hypothetical protein [Bacteroidales bacterium]
MKWILPILLGLFLAFAPTNQTKACEIEFKILKGEKEKYKAGDTIVILVEVKLTHRSCPVAMKKTKFKLNGMKVLKSTPWKQKSANDWERKLMIVVTETEAKKINLTAVRECEKDGGFGSMKLEME